MGSIGRLAVLDDVGRVLANLTSLIDSLQSAVLFEDEHRRIVHVNRSFCDTFEIDAPPTALLGADCSDAAEQAKHLFVDPEGFVDRISEILASREQVLAEPLAFRDGRTFERDYVPIFSGGTFLGHVWHYRDISHHKRREKGLREQLAIADRLASIGRLSAGVAHEINNPAAFVASNLSVTRERAARLAVELAEVRLSLQQDEFETTAAARMAGLEASVRELDQALVEAEAGVERIAQVSRGLRSFARVEPEDFQLVRLDTLLEFACKMAGNEIRHRARLVKRIEPVPPIAANEGKLAQVFTNLLANAVQALESGSADDNRIEVATSRDGDRILVEVSDSGCGISDSDLERIFDPFFTTKPRGQGTGLGLSLVRGIVSEHRGTVSVHSELGQGTRFVVALPVETGLPVRGRPARDLRVTLAPRSGRVLIIDDERSICRAFSLVLEKEHDVVAAIGGAEALRILEADTAFDAVVCDLMMPHIDGQGVYEAVQQGAPPLLNRFLFITGDAFTPRARAFLARIDNPVLDKPVTSAALRETVARLVSEPSTSHADSTD